ncbi:MAG: polysaccharide deacetylase family protein [Chitinivibrionales bacterium]|nr:polysaccharide deacetylase family protein [Chitinivibrionales bacterium]
MRIVPFHLWLVVAVIFIPCGIFFHMKPLAFLFGLAWLIGTFIWGVVSIQSQFFCRVLYKLPLDYHRIALTFDDGPDPNLTPEILAILAKYEFKATFFVIAKKAQQHPEIVRRCVEEGHTIACHDLSHSVVSNFRLSRQLRQEIFQAREMIASIIGKKPLLYRPPVGLMNPHIASVLAKLRMHCIGWSIKALDAGNRSPAGIRRIGALAKSSSIVLLHDSLPIPDYKNIIVEQIELLCSICSRKGLEPVTIDEAFDIDAYAESTVENAVSG